MYFLVLHEKRYNESTLKMLDTHRSILMLQEGNLNFGKRMIPVIIIPGIA